VQEWEWCAQGPAHCQYIRQRSGTRDEGVPIALLMSPYDATLLPLMNPLYD
jgi:hypothetical protein